MLRNLLIGAVVIAAIVAVPIMVLQRRQPVDETTAFAHKIMSSDLRGLVLAEATTRQLRGRYSNDPEEAGHISSPNVSLPVITLSDTGWSAIVTHKAIPGLRCGVGVYLPNPIRRSAKSGEIVCESRVNDDAP